MVRQYHSARLKITELGGALGLLLEGATVRAEVQLEMSEDVISAKRGPCRAVGKITSIKKFGIDIMDALGLISDEDFDFKARFTIPKSGTIDECYKEWCVSGSLNYADGFSDLDASLVIQSGIDLGGIFDRAAITVHSVLEREEVIDAPKPTPTPPTDLPDAPRDIIRGIMLTDAVCDTRLKRVRTEEYAYYRSAYNTILTLADLQKGLGKIITRPYVDWARDRNKLTDLGIRNIRWMAKQGYDVHLILLNSWAIKKGYGSLCGSVQADISENELYNSNQYIDEQVEFVQDVMAKTGDAVTSVMLTLEAEDPAVVPFSVVVASGLKDIGFTGSITNNLVGQARESGTAEMRANGIGVANSINRGVDWSSSTNDIRNSDGMFELNYTRTELITELTANPGPDGFYIWAKELVGDSNGRSKLRSEYADYAAKVVPEPPDVIPPLDPNQAPFDTWKRKLTWKTRYSGDPPNRLSSAFLVPRPVPKRVFLQPKRVLLQQGSETIEARELYWSVNERRTIARFGDHPGGELLVVFEYANGSIEQFSIPNAHTRFDIEPYYAVEQPWL